MIMPSACTNAESSSSVSVQDELPAPARNQPAATGVHRWYGSPADLVAHAPWRSLRKWLWAAEVTMLRWPVDARPGRIRRSRGYGAAGPPPQGGYGAPEVTSARWLWSSWRSTSASGYGAPGGPLRKVAMEQQAATAPGGMATPAMVYRNLVLPWPMCAARIRASPGAIAAARRHADPVYSHPARMGLRLRRTNVLQRARDCLLAVGFLGSFARIGSTSADWLGIAKLLTCGGVGIWALIDVILIGMAR